MKYGKKTMAIICTAACAAMSFALAACGRGNTPVNSNAGGEVNTNGEVTAEQWKAAIKATKELKNYTEFVMTSGVYYEGETYSSSIIKMYDNGICKMSLGDGSSAEEYYYIAQDYKLFGIGIQGNSVLRISTINRSDDESDINEFVKRETNSIFSNKGFLSLQWKSQDGKLDNLEEQYDAFTYDKASKSYYAKIYSKYGEIYDFTIAIENKYVTKIVMNNIDRKTKEQYEISNINKTKIQVPEYVWTAIQEYKEEDLI
ncbi:MAG: hypothetical protein K2M89_06510 [Clostridiales bacterium]|nr:hypothetical protein [Clostridiales bacterium]